MATKQFLRTNAQRFVDSGYLHSYKRNFLTVASQLDLTPLQVNQILDGFIAKKKIDFENFCKTYQINFDNDFSSELAKILISGNKNADDLLKSKINSILSKLDEPLFEEIKEKFNLFVESFDPADAIYSSAQQKKLATQKNIYLNKKESMSKTGFETLRNAFLKDLQNKDRETWESLRLILDSISKSGGSTSILATAVGLTKLSKESIDTKLDFEYLREQITSNLGLEDNNTRKSGIYNNVKGLFSEIVAEGALNQIENILVKGTGTSNVNNITAKADITIELPNADDILGVSVKNMVLIDEYSKNFKEATDLFKVQDLTLGNLDSMINMSPTAKAIPSIAEITEKVYYLIINEQFFATYGSRDKETKTYIKQEKTKKISDFLDSYFLALAGVWFGDGVANTMEEGTNTYLMNNGLVYDPNREIIIPVYKMLELIQEQITNYSGKMSSGKINYYFNTTINPDEFYREKIESAPTKGQKSQSYPQPLMDVGIAKGKQVKNNMKVSVTLLFLDELIKEAKIGN